jgi:hypothetical protein
MKKYMIADLVKDSREDLVLEAMEEYNLDRANSEIFVDNFPNQSTWADVEATAESLGVDITDVDDDDVENYMEMGGKSKGSLESSMGIIEWIYDNTAKAYAIHMVLKASCGVELQDRDILYYNISPEQMRAWNNSDSAGEYFNSYITGQPNDNGCGCCEDPCAPQDISQFNTKYSSLS